MTNVGKYTIAHDDTDLGDGSTFSVPTASSLEGEGYDLDLTSRLHYTIGYCHIDNGWDVAIDVTMYGSPYDDPGMDRKAQDGSTESIAAGGADFFLIESGHSHMEAEIAPAGDPTSGDLTLVFQVRAYST